jgi:predicted Zn-ribbon and HTH transcriptional regulator
MGKKSSQWSHDATKCSHPAHDEVVVKTYKRNGKEVQVVRLVCRTCGLTCGSFEREE